ncbi:MAG TPA: hypothetical protein VF422_06325, partial [Dokdonella sp.]
MDPEQIKGIVMFLGIAENIVGSDIIPGLKKLLGAHYALTAEEQAEVDKGYADLMAVRAKLKARRDEIAAE